MPDRVRKVKYCHLTVPNRAGRGAEVFEELRAGRFVILVDDPDRENEGDLVMAAQHVQAEDVAFMLRHTSGILCVTMPGERASTSAAAICRRRASSLSRA